MMNFFAFFLQLKYISFAKIKLRDELFKNIEHGMISYPDYISPKAVDLLKKVIKFNFREQNLKKI